MKPYRTSQTSHTVVHTHPAPHLERIAAICLAVDHVHDFLVDRLARRVARRPDVAGADAILADVEVFRVVEAPVRARLDAIDDLRAREQSYLPGLQHPHLLLAPDREGSLEERNGCRRTWDRQSNGRTRQPHARRMAPTW